MSSLSAAPPAITYLHPAGAQRGTTVEVTAAGTLDAATKVWVSGTGVSVEPAKDKGKLTVTVAKDAAPGTYWLRAYNADGASGLRPFVVGAMPDAAEKEPNDDFRKSQPIDGPAVVNGRLEKNGDVDCFAVAIKEGQTLVASLEAHRTLRSPMDGVLQVLSADGFVLEENNDSHGLDPQVAFTPKKAGTYVVRLFAFPATPDSSIRHFGSEACVYRLTLTTGGFADHTLPLAASEGNTEAVEVRGWNIPPAAATVTPARGTPGDPFAAVFGPGLANAVRVRSEPHPVHGLKAAGPLRPPFSATGRIDAPRGEAVIAFEGKKGAPLTLQAESRVFGLAVNPVVRVLDKDGKQLARAEPGKLNGDTTLTFSPPADGVYTAAVGDLYAGGGPRHAFLLRVLSGPDYELSVAADRFTASPDKPATVAVKVTRLRGFDKPISVVAEGLPAGVTVEVTKPAKPDPNTITLSLAADRPVSAPFRLVGTVGDDPRLRRRARVVLPDFDDPPGDLWLTAPPAPKP